MAQKERFVNHGWRSEPVLDLLLYIYQRSCNLERLLSDGAAIEVACIPPEIGAYYIK